MNRYGVDRIQRGNTQLGEWIDSGEVVEITRDDAVVAICLPIEEYERLRAAVGPR